MGPTRRTYRMIPSHPVLLTRSRGSVCPFAGSRCWETCNGYSLTIMASRHAASTLPWSHIRAVLTHRPLVAASLMAFVRVCDLSTPRRPETSALPAICPAVTVANRVLHRERERPQCIYRT